MEKRPPATGFRLFLKSFLISLLIIIPIYLTLYFTLLKPGGDSQPAQSEYSNLPVYARSQNLLLAVCDDGGEPLFACAIRFDVEQNRIAAAVIPASALPEPSSSAIPAGGTPSAYMESCVSALSAQYRLAFGGYIALDLTAIESLVDYIGSFRHNVTVPITALAQSGLEAFRLEKGFQLISGGTAAAILRYCSTLPEQQYVEIVSQLLESCLSEYIPSGFADLAMNAFYSVFDRSATDIGATGANTFLNAARSVCENGGLAKLVTLPGSYTDSGFEPSGTLTDFFS